MRSTASSSTSACRRTSTPPSCTRPRSCRCTGCRPSIATCASTSCDRRGVEGGDHTDPDYDPLQKLLEVFSGVEVVKGPKEDRSGWPVEQRLSQRIIDGDRDGLEPDLELALAQGTPALDIINDTLLAGMKVVGE